MKLDNLSWTQSKKSGSILIQSARYLQGVRCFHDRNVQQRSFNIGDLVLRWIQDETRLHKLNSRWEGPFIVSKVTRPGSYRITDADGNEVPNSWNVEHLHKFYPWFSHMMVSVDLFNKEMVYLSTFVYIKGSYQLVNIKINYCLKSFSNQGNLYRFIPTWITQFG